MVYIFTVSHLISLMGSLCMFCPWGQTTKDNSKLKSLTKKKILTSKFRKWRERISYCSTEKTEDSRLSHNNSEFMYLDLLQDVYINLSQSNQWSSLVWRSMNKLHMNAVTYVVPHRMKINTEFNLATCFGLVESMDLNISECSILEIHSHKKQSLTFWKYLIS